MKHSVKLLILILAMSAACTTNDDDTTPGEGGPSESACGVTACAVDETADDTYDVDKLPAEHVNGKADAVDRVRDTIAEVSADMVIDVLDVQKIVEAMGENVSVDEIRALATALDEQGDLFEEDAIKLAERMALTANIGGEERDTLLSKTTFAGTKLPEEVYALLVKARLHGAVSYDVNEVDDDGETIWTPYPATTEATGNMTFAYTEITPEVLAADIADTDVVYNRIVGEKTSKTYWGQEYQEVTYEEGKGGTGNILAHYDHVWHADIYARGRSGQKWANNFAILSDGTIHCLPAARRSETQDLILTNPHLSRGKHMMFNGHLDVRAGVVVGVEMSGRLSKIASKGKATFIDPIALLEAWGFEISPNVRLRYGNTGDGAPVQVAEEGVIRAAK